MWHYPIIQLVFKHPSILVFSRWYEDYLLIIFPITIAGSSLSYFIVEKPFFGLRTVYAKYRGAAVPQTHGDPHSSGTPPTSKKVAPNGVTGEQGTQST
jgi:peptidoglycan/LPS O-acetylase OafA/YrhL